MYSMYDARRLRHYGTIVQYTLISFVSSLYIITVMAQDRVIISLSPATLMGSRSSDEESGDGC